MKLLFILASLCLSMFSVTKINSQTVPPGTIVLQGTYTNTLGLDTLGASETIYFKNISSLASIALEGRITALITMVSLSGTVSATVSLEGSIDGVVWEPGINKVAGTNGKNTDTLTFSAAGTKSISTCSVCPVQSLSSTGVVEQTYYTGLTRRYFIRLKITSPAGTQGTKIYARLITQD